MILYDTQISLMEKFQVIAIQLSSQYERGDNCLLLNNEINEPNKTNWNGDYEGNISHLDGSILYMEGNGGMVDHLN